MGTTNKHPPRREGRGKAAMQVTVGEGWSRFTYAREDMALIGVVQTGLQIGALARLPAGGYVQVNGDFVQALSTSRVNSAMRRAGPRRAAAPERKRAPAPMPVVTVKKRRLLAPPSAAAEDKSG